jgi:hypothetical protein
MQAFNRGDPRRPPTKWQQQLGRAKMLEQSPGKLSDSTYSLGRRLKALALL